jgi:hypothetical protein
LENYKVVGSRQEAVTGSYAQNNGLIISITDGEFLDHSRAILFIKKNLLHCVGW